MTSKTKKRYPREQFTKHLWQTVDTDAFRALSATAQALYPIIKFEWKGPKANNNGKIRLSYRQAAKILGIKTIDTIGRACADLQAKGFLVVTEEAVLGTDGEGRGFAYEITELAMPGKDSRGRALLPRALFKDWRPGSDYPVARANANNPNGKNGKTKSHPENHDAPVPKIMTNQQKASRKSGRPVMKMMTE